MSIKLEVGRRYVNRQGKVWAPVIASSDPDDFYKFEMVYEGWTYHFSEAGRLFEAEESPCDLIALAPDEAPQQPDELATLRERVRELDDQLAQAAAAIVHSHTQSNTLRAENARLVGVLKSVRPFVAHFKGGWSIHTPATISTAELLSDIDTALAQTEAENG